MIISKVFISKVFISKVFISKVFISNVFIRKVFISKVFISKFYILRRKSFMHDVYRLRYFTIICNTDEYKMGRGKLM